VSTRTCLVERDAGGDRIRAVRLVGPHADARWQSPRTPEGYAQEPAEDAEEAADWIAQRLAVDEDRLGVVVLDAAGAYCQWVQAPAADARAVRASYERGTASATEDEGLGLGEDFDEADEQPPQLGGRPEPHEASIEPLAAAALAEGGVRVGVLVAADAVVRLLLDALDSRGVGFEGVASVWHALACAAGGSDPAAHERVVADSPQVLAGVLVEPGGRLTWAWSAGSQALAGGTVRLTPHDDGPVLTRADLARLANDWIAWAAQLGASPARVVVFSCPTADAASTGDGDALTPEQACRVLGELWPEAVVDSEVSDDPLGAVLRRLEGAPLGELSPGRSMSTLATRPGRLARRGYQMAALALVCLGLALGAFGLRWRAQVGAVDADRQRLRSAWLEQVRAVEDQLGMPGEITGDLAPMLKLRSVVDQRTRAGDITRPPPRPMLGELENIAFLLMDFGDAVDLGTIRMNNTVVTVDLTTDSPDLLGQINRKMQDLGMNAGAIDWQSQQTARGQRYSVTLTGTWAAADAREGRS